MTKCPRLPGQSSIGKLDPAYLHEADPRLCSWDRANIELSVSNSSMLTHLLDTKRDTSEEGRKSRNDMEEGGMEMMGKIEER